jgi:CheY-like chemotaxis protein
MTGARVILVEDDPSLRRFVAMALSDLRVDLVPCGDVPDAIAALSAGPARLVITDLMLPGEPGSTLVARLHQDAALRGNARVVVFSAGLTPQLNTELTRMGVWRQLHKPVPLAELRACVSEALAEAPAAPVEAPAAAPAGVAFGGNQAMFERFRAACLLQFADDVQRGDAACQAEDAPALRRLAHSLVSVLSILGHTEASAVAARVETLATAGGTTPLWDEWAVLRQALRALAPPDQYSSPADT